jgi:hypothetical protein
MKYRRQKSQEEDSECGFHLSKITQSDLTRNVRGVRRREIREIHHASAWRFRTHPQINVRE